MRRQYNQDALFYFPLVDAGSVDFVASVTIAAGDAKVFTDEQISANPTAEAIAFTSGSEVPAAGDTLVGATSTETAVFMFAVVTSGTWAGGDAAGFLFCKTVSGVFQSENINIQGGTANVLTIGGDFTTGIFVTIGNSMYAIALTAAEMSCKQGEIHIIDSATKEWEDQAIQFETEGHADSLHPANVNVTSVSGSSDAANNMETVFDTDFATNYDTDNDVWVIDASGVEVSADIKENYMLPPGMPYPTVRYTTDDTVDMLTDAGDDIVNDRRANWAFVKCASANNVRYAMAADPVQGAGELGIDMVDGDSVTLLGRSAVERFRYTSSVNGSASAIIVTFGYNPNS